MTTSRSLAERFATTLSDHDLDAFAALIHDEGVPASGNEIEMHSIDIWRVRDGRLAEHWDELNTLEVFQQIGAVPELR